MSDQDSKNKKNVHEVLDYQNENITEEGQVFLSFMESLMNITLAGFGGALAGLSISRRRGTMGIQTIQQSVIHKGATKVVKTPKGAAYIDHDLPVTWAFTCMSFATILECCKKSSPTTLLMNFTFPSTTSKQIADTEINVIGDYTLGGGVAGAVFKGSVIRSAENARMRVTPSMMAAQRAGKSLMTSGSVFGGFITGATLGCLAGITVFGLHMLERILQVKLGGKDIDNSFSLEENQERTTGINDNESNREDFLQGLSSTELKSNFDELSKLAKEIEITKPK